MFYEFFRIFGIFGKIKYQNLDTLSRVWHINSKPKLFCRFSYIVRIRWKIKGYLNFSLSIHVSYFRLLHYIYSHIGSIFTVHTLNVYSANHKNYNVLTICSFNHLYSFLKAAKHHLNHHVFFVSEVKRKAKLDFTKLSEVPIRY